MTRRENEERKKAMRQFFRDHPDATGDEAQDALTSGKLTGKKGPSLSTGTLYTLRREALESLDREKRAPTPPPAPAAPAPAAAPSAALEKLRDLGRAVQDVLRTCPTEIQGLRVVRDGAVTIIRVVPNEEVL